MSTEVINRPKIEINEETKEPKQYHVFILNDDKSTFDFVINVLMGVFDFSAEKALEITLNVHHQGRGHAGTFPFEIAETKTEEVKDMANAAGFPLRAIFEPEE